MRARRVYTRGRAAGAAAPLALALFAGGCLLPGQRGAYVVASDGGGDLGMSVDVERDVASGDPSSEEAPAPDARPDDVADASDEQDVPPAMDALDVANVADVADAADVVDAVAPVDAVDVLPVMDALDVPAVSDVVDVVDVVDVADVVDVVDVSTADVPATPRCARATVVSCEASYGARDDFRNDCLDTNVWDAARTNGVSVERQRAVFYDSADLVAARAFAPTAAAPVQVSAQWGPAVAGVERAIRMRSAADGSGGVACAMRAASAEPGAGWSLCAEDLRPGGASSCSPAAALDGAPWVELRAFDDGARVECRAQVVGASLVTAQVAASASSGSRVSFHTGRAAGGAGAPVTLDNAQAEQGLPRARAEYGFDEPRGRDFYDRSAALDGTLRGVGGADFVRTPDNGYFGGGLTFQSSGSSEGNVDAALLRFNEQPYTVSFWVSNTAYPAGLDVIELFGNRPGSSGGVFFGIRLITSAHPMPAQQNGLAVEIDGDEGGPEVPYWVAEAGSGGRLTPEMWRHVVISRGAMQRIFTAGEEGTFTWQGTGRPRAVPLSRVAGVRIGAGPEPARWYRGRFDELRVFDAELTACQRSVLTARP